MFSNFKIGTRLSLAFGLLLALVALMGAAAVWQMQGLSANTRYFADNIVPSLEVQHRVSAGIADLRRLQYMHVASNSDQEMDQIEARLASTHQAVDALLQRYAKELVSDDTDQRDLDAIRAGLQALDKDWAELRPVSRRTASDPTQTEVANKLLTGASARDYAAVQASISQWWDYNVKLGKDQASESAAGATRGLWMIAALIAASLLIGIGAAWTITRSITGPLRGALGLAQAVAAGDLSTHFHAAGSDETGQLVTALGRMKEQLGEIVGEVRRNAEGVATASAQIASGNQDLSQRTEEQASALEQTAASMEELSSTVKQNADSAQQANQLALGAAGVARRGGEVVAQVVETMKGINDSSSKIADIISVIDGIAFQTNILALNAAVEAARAGEQGRGFAVVASEVRSLASRSAAAAKEIKSLITASVERVGQGSAQVDQAGETMTEVVRSIGRVTDIMGEISAASAEQSSGVAQVGQAVGQMDQMTQQNSALVEQSAAAAESLKVQARHLVDTVAVFKLAADAGAAPNPRVAHESAPHSAPRSTPLPTPKASPARAPVQARTPARAPVHAPAPRTRTSLARAPAPSPAKAVPASVPETADWESF